MAKFFKSLFGTHSTLTSDKKKVSKSVQDVSMQSQDTTTTPDFDEREFTTPYDTKKKMYTSRSGRMKHNQKVRGTLRKDLFGDSRHEEKSHIEYHVHGRAFTENFFQPPTANEIEKMSSASSDDLKKSLENVYKLAKQENMKENSEPMKNGRRKSKPEEEDMLDVEQEIESIFKPVLIETTL